MLKAPRPGRVKTRLAAEVGVQKAAQIYRRLVDHQIKQLPPGWPVEIHFTPGNAMAEISEWLGSEFNYFPQADGNLGLRLASAAEGAFGRGASSVMFLGGDCPGVDKALLRKAADSLLENDVVIGPAEDGGYYLLGLRKQDRLLFYRVDWGTGKVLEQTLDRIKDLGWRSELLERLPDVDRLADWIKVEGQIP